MKTIIKVAIALLLLGCLLKMPYGYYRFVRLAACAGFVALAYWEFAAKKEVLGILCVGAAILFNPIWKVYFKRETWQVIDVILGVTLIGWATYDFIMRNKNSKAA